jgi:hypothetical protein
MDFARIRSLCRIGAPGGIRASVLVLLLTVPVVAVLLHLGLDGTSAVVAVVGILIALPIFQREEQRAIQAWGPPPETMLIGMSQADKQYILARDAELLTAAREAGADYIRYIERESGTRKPEQFSMQGFAEDNTLMFEVPFAPWSDQIDRIIAAKRDTDETVSVATNAPDEDAADQFLNDATVDVMYGRMQDAAKALWTAAQFDPQIVRHTQFESLARNLIQLGIDYTDPQFHGGSEPPRTAV